MKVDLYCVNMMYCSKLLISKIRSKSDPLYKFAMAEMLKVKMECHNQLHFSAGVYFSVFFSACYRRKTEVVRGNNRSLNIQREYPASGLASSCSISIGHISLLPRIQTCLLASFSHFYRLASTLH